MCQEGQHKSAPTLLPPPFPQHSDFENNKKWHFSLENDVYLDTFIISVPILPSTTFLGSSSLAGNGTDSSRVDEWISAKLGFFFICLLVLINDTFSDFSEVSGVTVDWFQYNQVCQFALIKRSLSFVQRRDAGQNATTGQQTNGNAPLTLLTQLYPWTTDLYLLWMRSRKYAEKFLQHLWMQFHIAHSCNLPLFLLTEGIKKLTQTAVQTPLFFYVAKVKKVWTAVSVKQIQVASLKQSFYKICKIMFLFSELLYFFFITLLL